MPALLTVLHSTVAALTLSPMTAYATPSIAQFGEPRYPANFTHFDYANPDAPADGALNFGNYGELQSYNSLNDRRRCQSTTGPHFSDLPHQSLGALLQR
jgi:microcin C transport system substrate-binding protein